MRDIEKDKQILMHNMTLEQRLSHLEKRIAKLERQLNIDLNNDDLDDKFLEACHLLLQYDKVSASMLQRRLGIGYARAARILDQLEEQQLVSIRDDGKLRDVDREMVLKYLNKNYGNNRIN